MYIKCTGSLTDLYRPTWLRTIAVQVLLKLEPKRGSILGWSRQLVGKIKIHDKIKLFHCYVVILNKYIMSVCCTYLWLFAVLLCIALELRY